MAFSRVKPAGWAFGEILTSSQMNSLDTDHANAIDGAAGGTYALSAPLVLNGSNVTVDKSLAVHTDCTITGQLVASGAVTFFDDMTVGNSSSDAATFNAIVSCLRDFSVDGNTVLGNASGDTLTVNATSTVNAAATFASDVAVNGNLTVGNASTDVCTITARTVDSFAAAAMGSTTTLGTARWLLLSAASTLTTTFNSSASSGQIIFIYNSSSNTQNFVGDLIYAGFPALSGAALRYNGSAWAMINAWTFVP